MKNNISKLMAQFAIILDVLDKHGVEVSMPEDGGVILDQDFQDQGITSDLTGIAVVLKRENIPETVLKLVPTQH